MRVRGVRDLLDRAEYLLCGDAHVVLHVCKHRRLNEVAVLADPLSTDAESSAFLLPALDQAHYLVHLGLIYLQNDILWNC